MALIKCPECNKEISDKVKSCPFCGFPFESNADIQQVEISSVNIATKDPAKTKKLITGAIIAVIILVLGFVAFSVIKNNDEKKKFNVYIDNLNFARETMLDGGGEAEVLLNLTARVWRNSIYEERDLQTNKYTMIGNTFNDDFNTSLSALMRDASTQSTISAIEDNQALVAPVMKELQNPPIGLENSYDTVTELYSVYKSLTDLAINPSGSLQSFIESKSQKVDKFMELFQKLEIQMPEKK